MWTLSCSLLLLLSAPLPGQASNGKLHSSNDSIVDAYLLQLRHLLTEILFVTAAQPEERCFVVFTDDLHRSIYNGQFFDSSLVAVRSYFVLRLADADDPLSRQQSRAAAVWRQLRAAQCGLQIITLANGFQVRRLLRYVDQQRALNMRGKFVLLYDARLLEPELWPIWCSLPGAVFLKQTAMADGFDIVGLPFPHILSGLLTTHKLLNWRPGKRIAAMSQLFPQRAADWQDITLRVAVIEHAPLVMRLPAEGDNASGSGNSYSGVEVQLMRALGVALHFRPRFYAAADSATERWGRRLANGSYTGLLAELASYRAHFAIGGLHLYELYYRTLDLSQLHMVDCLTFLTPEATADDTWRTLIQPFSAGMWCGVLVSLFLVGSIFYLISYLNEVVLREPQTLSTSHFFRCMRRANKLQTGPLRSGPQFGDARFRTLLQRLSRRPAPEPAADLFDNYANCILLTYSMLLYVALPRMPRNWPLRVLTGWFWVYCMLVVVTYRASLTAILANPAVRLTIDTLQDLAHSRVAVAAGGEEHRRLLTQAVDELAQRIGQRMEIVDSIDCVTERIALGKCAYYDSKDYLLYLRRQQSATQAAVHVMRDCVVRLPVALGMVRNSALKPAIDDALQRLSEAGLLSKWLRDYTANANSADRPAQEAVVNLSKIWSSFVALTVGLTLAAAAVVGERLYWRHVVRGHPLYDEYNHQLYYNYKQRLPRYAPNAVHNARL